MSTPGAKPHQATAAAAPFLFKKRVLRYAPCSIANEPITNNVLPFFSTYQKSLLQNLQEAIPLANFVKAFNSVGAALMVHPPFGDTKPSMFICGNNEQAKKEVSEIVELFGFEAEDLGKQEAARAIEPLCILWCIEGFTKNIWDKHAIKLIRTT